MDSRTTSAHNFRAKLEQYNVILTKEKSVLTEKMSSFEGESMQILYNVLSYRIELHFHDYKLTIMMKMLENDENGHSDRNIDYEIRRKKAIEQELICKFTRVDSDKEGFDIFKTANKIFRHIKQSTKKTLINEISRRLLELEFKSDNIIKPKSIKFIVKKYFLIISNNENLLFQL